MAKKRGPHPDQGDFFDMPAAHAVQPGGLFGIDERFARAVAEILKSDDRERAVIAAEMSVLLEYEVSKAMLDAYASPARDGHNISIGRFLALIVVTGRVDTLDRELRRIGIAVTDRNGLLLAEMGHLKQEMMRMESRYRQLRAMAHPVEGVRK